ncbi:MAG: transglycosylase domain-containing protein [Clostridiales bacterium]|jgi:membrane peptidoglycan carboxypeptidase|nr:transglycosylase domain-containing protein [Clostridiales bacterium]
MKKTKKTLFKKISLFICLLFITGAAVFSAFFFTASFGVSLDASKIAAAESKIQIFDIYDGRVLTKYDKSYAKYKDIPKNLVNAFVASEDKRFFSHRGVDPVRIAGALVSDVKAGGFVEGASTINQQLIKNTHLSDEKTLTRKAKEIKLAIMLDKAYPKEKILEVYLNGLYFGNSVYGVKNAAKFFFGKELFELSLSECAALAAVIKNPSKYSPVKNPNDSRAGRALVLKRMKACGYISAAEEETARAEGLSLNKKNADARSARARYTDINKADSNNTNSNNANINNANANNANLNNANINNSDSIPTEKDTDAKTSNASAFFSETNISAPYIDAVLSEAEKITGIDKKTLIASEYKIATFFDPGKQNLLFAALSDERYSLKNKNGKIPDAMAVLADNGGGINAFYSNRYIGDLFSLKRQPGSTVKPILVYAPAFKENLISPASIVDDAKKDFGGYSPSNYRGKYLGYTTVRNAVKHSSNVAAVEILNALTPEKSKAFAREMNINLSNRDNLNIALGGLTDGLSPAEITGGYVMLANRGNFRDLGLIRSIRGKDGNLIYEKSLRAKKILSDEDAYLMTDILCETSKSGTTKFLAGLPFAAASKSGTAANAADKRLNNDAWNVTYTTEDTLLVWQGNLSNSAENALSGEVTGGSYPTLIAKKILTDLYRENPPGNFQKPGGIITLNLDKNIMETEHKLTALKTVKDEKIYTDIFKTTNLPEFKREIKNDGSAWFRRKEQEDGGWFHRDKNNGAEWFEREKNYDGEWFERKKNNGSEWFRRDKRNGAERFEREKKDNSAPWFQRFRNFFQRLS